jgi:hypothetical protein
MIENFVVDSTVSLFFFNAVLFAFRRQNHACTTGHILLMPRRRPACSPAPLLQDCIA